MKNILGIKVWMTIAIGFLLALSIWAIFFVDKIDNKIAIFGIVGVIITAITSVLSVTLSNKHVRDRDRELLIIKEKQKVFEHFYNALFEILKNIKKNKSKPLTSQIENEMMQFKRGLMNWGSEELIQSYLAYEAGLNNPEENKDASSILEIGDKFLKDIRKEMGFQDSNKVNIMSVILNHETRNELENNK